MANEFNMFKCIDVNIFGEFGFIDYFMQCFLLYYRFFVKGIGDDVVVIDYQGVFIVVFIDMLVEGIYFDLMYMFLKYLGYKLVVVNFFDIYVMNVIFQ